MITKDVTLKEAGCFNANHEKIYASVFDSTPFFDKKDIVQVKYEMVRAASNGEGSIRQKREGLWEARYTVDYDPKTKKLIRDSVYGKTKAEVIELLGEDFYSRNENHLAYDLGLLPGSFAPCPDVLEIYFENGKVVKVRQRTT